MLFASVPSLHKPPTLTNPVSHSTQTLLPIVSPTLQFYIYVSLAFVAHLKSAVIKWVPAVHYRHIYLPSLYPYLIQLSITYVSSVSSSYKYLFDEVSTYFQPESYNFSYKHTLVAKLSSFVVTLYKISVDLVQEVHPVLSLSLAKYGYLATVSLFNFNLSWWSQKLVSLHVGVSNL